MTELMPLPLSCCAGAVHGDEGPVHEERPRLRPGILHHSTVHLQRPAGPERTDSTSKGHRGCKSALSILTSAPRIFTDVFLMFYHG